MLKSGKWRLEALFPQAERMQLNKPMLINHPPEMIQKGIIFNQISGLAFSLANCISLYPPASVSLYHLPKDVHFTVFKVPPHRGWRSLPSLCPLSSQKHEWSQGGNELFLPPEISRITSKHCHAVLLLFQADLFL